MIPYFQTTPFTTAAASLLTILHHFQPQTPLTREKEFDIWHKTVNLPTRASSIYALATYAKQAGLSPTIIVEHLGYAFPDYRFYRYTKEEIDLASISANIHLQRAKQENIPIKQQKITLEEVKKYLTQEKILLIRLNMKPIRESKRNTSNYIIVHGYAQNQFHCIDPAHTALSIPEEVMQEAFNSLKTKKHRDHRMIIF